MHRVRISLKPINGLEGSTRTLKYPRNRMIWVHTPQHPHYRENHVHFPTFKIPSFCIVAFTYRWRLLSWSVFPIIRSLIFHQGHSISITSSNKHLVSNDIFQDRRTSYSRGQSSWSATRRSASATNRFTGRIIARASSAYHIIIGGGGEDGSYSYIIGLKPFFYQNFFPGSRCKR